MTKLAEMHAAGYRAGDTAMMEAEIQRLLPEVPNWQLKEVNGEKRLERVFKFKDFAEALAFTDKVGALAQEENHHPMLITEWGQVTVDWWTHKVKGLHQNDFIMAAKTDELMVHQPG